MRPNTHQKHPHPSATWTTAQKRNSLQMIRLQIRPHFSVLTPSLERLPTIGYLVLDEGGTGISEEGPFEEPAPAELRDWIASNGFPVPAIRFKVEASLEGEGYVTDRRAQISAGILRRDSVKSWVRIPSIQQLWFPSVWVATGYPLKDFAELIFNQAEKEQLTDEFLLTKSLDELLTEQQKIFVAITCLHAAWWKLDIHKTVCAKHIVQLGLKALLEPKNFWNYAAEAGWEDMGDSQVERLWAKLLTAQRKNEKFISVMRQKRAKDLERFLKTNGANPFIYEVLRDLEAD